jgi:hypothetical protein
MNILRKIFAISIALAMSAGADTFRLSCDGDAVVLDQIQQFSVGQILVGAPEQKSFMRGNFAEIWLYGENIQALKDFTGRHKAKKIEVSFGNLVLSEMRLLSAIEDGRISFSLRGKQVEKFQLAMDRLEKKGNEDVSETPE